MEESFLKFVPMSKETEKSSRYDALEQMGLRDLLENINREDQTVPLAVAEAMNQIEALADAIFHKMETGGAAFLPRCRH